MSTNVEKLCLGTVQLGMRYGIRSQRSDKPSSDESVVLLKDAYELGIRYFDTASAYGDAEKLIGESGISGYADVKLITKVSKETYRNLSDSIEESLSRLDADSIDGLMLHKPQEYYNGDVVKELIQIREKGLVMNIGVSVYEPEDAVRIARDGVVNYIQIPYNVLDQRLDNTEFFSLTKKNRIKIFARSSFLQGLLLFDLHELPEKFRGVKEYLKKYASIVSEYGFNKREAAMLFSVCKPEIDEVVFGVDNEQQLRDNLTILERCDGFEECRSQLDGAFEGISPVFLNPSRWSEL